MPDPKLVLILSLDELNAAYLGCYGNEWIATPAIDALAAEGLTYDFAFCEQVESLNEADSQQQFRQYHDQLKHRLVSSCSAASIPVTSLSLSAQATTNPEVTLDADALQDYLLPSGLNPQALEYVQAQIAEDHRLRSSAEPDSAIVDLFDRVVNQVNKQRQTGGIVWVDVPLQTGWAVPDGEQDFYLNDSEQACRVIPSGVVGQHIDADRLAGIRAAYAGRVRWFDQLIGALHASLRKSGAWQQLLFVLTAKQGFALGEHGEVGFLGSTLGDERTHVPLVIAGSVTRPNRRSADMVNLPGDLLATLVEQVGIKQEMPDSHSLLARIAGNRGTMRPYAVTSMSQTQALQSSFWKFVLSRQSSADQNWRSLYERPEDRWDQRDQAAELGELADRYELALRRYLSAKERQEFSWLPHFDPQ